MTFPTRRFFVANLADDGYVRHHAQEACDQSSQVDFGAVGPSWSGLHLRHVGQRHFGFEHFLGNDDAERRVELGGATTEQCGLSGTRSTGEDDRLSSFDGRPEEVGGLGAEHVATDELVQAANGNAGELSNVDDGVIVPTETFGGVELAVGRRWRRRGSW